MKEIRAVGSKNKNAITKNRQKLQDSCWQGKHWISQSDETKKNDDEHTLDIIQHNPRGDIFVSLDILMKQKLHENPNISTDLAHTVNNALASHKDTNI